MRFKAVLFAVFCLSFAGMAQKIEGNGNGGSATTNDSSLVSSNPHSATGVSRGGANVLWDQTEDNSTNGVPAQNFEVAFDAYDSMGADDFEVPAGTTWSVDGFVFEAGVATGPADNATVEILADDNGTPGAVMHSFTVAATFDGTFLDVPIPATELAGGIYWVAMTINMDFGVGGQLFWSNTASATTLSDGHWINPEDGFGSGCTDWASIATCGVGGGQAQLQFDVLGEEVACTISDIMVSEVNGNTATVTVYGACDDFDLYADGPNGTTLVGTGLSVDGVESFDVDFYADAVYYASGDGGATAVDGVTSTRTVPTLGEWGLILFLGGLTMAALFFMRRRNALS